MDRPFLWVTGGWILGLYLSTAANPALTTAMAGVFLLIIGTWRRPAYYRPALIAATIFLVVGILYGVLRSPVRHGDELSELVRSFPDAEFVLKGSVVEAPLAIKKEMGTSARALSNSFVLKVHEVEVGENIYPVRSRVSVEPQRSYFHVEPGDDLVIRARLNANLARVNFALSSAEFGYHRKRIFTRAVMVEPPLEYIPAPITNPRKALARLRENAARRICAFVPEPVKPFILRVYLGERILIDREAQEPYYRTGTAHIFAVSGLHIGIFFAFFEFFFSLLYIPKRAGALLKIGMVFLFTFLTGAHPSAFRAATMVALYKLGDVFDREVDSANTLCLSAFLFALVDPSLVFDLSAQLSFLSVASIFLFTSLFLDVLPVMPLGLHYALALTCSAVIVPIPLTWHVFQTAPLLGVLSNVLVVPIFTAALWLTSFALLLSFVSLGIAQVLGFAIYLCVMAIERLVTFAAAVPLSYVHTSLTTLPSAVGYFAAVLALAFLLRQRPLPWKRASLALVLGVAALAMDPFFVIFFSGSGCGVIVDFLDVGHGDATVVRAQSRAVLVDAGDRNDYVDYGAAVVVPFLRAHHVRRLDALVLTHDDRDHYGGATAVLSEFPVNALIIPPLANVSEGFRAILDDCARRDIPVRVLADGDEMDFSPLHFDVLNPPREPSDNLSDNARSLVLRLSFNGLRVLLTADIEADTEAKLVLRDCAADVLKVPHHGSSTSSSERFLDAVAPKWAVVSGIKRRRFTPMPPEVAERYRARDITVWRTDEWGGIRFQSDGRYLRIETARGAMGYSVGARSLGRAPQ